MKSGTRLTTMLGLENRRDGVSVRERVVDVREMEKGQLETESEVWCLNNSRCKEEECMMIHA